MKNPWQSLQGLERILADENNVCDLLLALSDEDLTPWSNIIGAEVIDVSREQRLGKRRGNADLILETSSGSLVMIEVKLGHNLSEEQRKKYEAWREEDTSRSLILAAYSCDRDSVANLTHWKFIALPSLFEGWLSSISPFARALSEQVHGILTAWDTKISGTFNTAGVTPLRIDSLTSKFLARVAARKIATALETRGEIEALAGVTSGGGLPLVQAYRRVPLPDREAWFIAEVRWWESKPGGELRFGTEINVKDASDRFIGYHLAKSYGEVLNPVKLKEYLEKTDPYLASAIDPFSHKARTAHSEWPAVLQRGYRSQKNPTGVEGSRLTINCEFVGDKDFRYENICSLDFSKLDSLAIEKLHRQPLSI